MGFFLFGKEKDVAIVNSMNICFYNITFGVLIFISLLNLIQFAINIKKKEYLYLGIVALSLAMRIGTAGYCSLALMFPWFNAAIKIKCEYLALWLTPAYILKTIITLYPSATEIKIFNKIPEKIVYKTIVGTLYLLGISSLILPARYSNHLVPVLECAEFISIFYGLALCICLMIQKRKYIIILFSGSIILTVGSIFDFLYTKQKEVLPVSTFPLFVVIFIFFFLGLLAAFQTNIFKNTVKTSNELKVLNKAYIRFVPKEFLTLIKKDDITKVQLGDYANIVMPVMFSKTFIDGNLTAEETFSIFNEYLELISPVIQESDGFVSKFLSGGFIALFKSSAKNSLHAAENIQKICFQLNQKYKSRNISINTYIALHSGKMILGTIGEENRMDDTVISDTVNTASRIESVCERLKKPIILSLQIEEIIRNENPDLSLIPLEKIEVKGKSLPLQLFEYPQKEKMNETTI